MRDSLLLVIRPDKVHAFIFDLDGVITVTANLHAQSWKQMFDEYLKIRADRDNVLFEPFEDSDYRMYIDGKPRYDGVESFLASRKISIPYGSKDDTSSKETVCALGNRKNEYFLQILDKQGVKIYQSSIDFVDALRIRGVKTAIISSSRNCAPILRVAGIQDLFDAKVDGVDLDMLKMRGKPDPSMFIEASRRIGVKPEFAAIVEDSLAGVEAGQRGGFALVIGVAREENARELKVRGADLVVTDLRELELGEELPEKTRNHSRILPSAIDSNEIRYILDQNELVVFLDYDGTLTEIVEDPTKALMSAETRNVLSRLASLCNVAILSGRDLEDVRRLVGIDNIVYSGCHGFDIMTSDGKTHDDSAWSSFLPYIDLAEKELQTLKRIPGLIIERKRFAISVHYRKVDPTYLQEIQDRVKKVVSSLPSLRESRGKKVFEILPNVDWDKGKALLSLLHTLQSGRSGVMPIFIGDDLTDEDAFKVIHDTGVGILVGEVNRDTFARFSLRNPFEVRLFLENLVSTLKERKT